MKFLGILISYIKNTDFGANSRIELASMRVQVFKSNRNRFYERKNKVINSHEMKIFIGLKVPRGDVEREAIVAHLERAIRLAGHIPFVAVDEIVGAGLTKPKDFMPFVRDALADCDLMIVIYHPELRGGLIEVGIAYQRKIPIWLCHKADEKISSSMLGCADEIFEYAGADGLSEQVFARL